MKTPRARCWVCGKDLELGKDRVRLNSYGMVAHLDCWDVAPDHDPQTGEINWRKT